MLIDRHRFKDKMYANHARDFSRHDKTQISVKNAIAGIMQRYRHRLHDILEVGGHKGYQTIIYRDQLANPKRTVIYDWKDTRAEEVRELVEFTTVDLETQCFPDSDSSFDVVICNQVLEHIKNIFTPLSEMHRVLRPGGLLILSVPNLAALHNCVLLTFGRQPTTIRLMGSHIRGYAIWAMSDLLRMNSHFRILDLKGMGLHPFTSTELPGFLKTFCHTPIWICEKQVSSKPLWEEERKALFTTTSFFSE